MNDRRLAAVRLLVLEFEQAVRMDETKSARRAVEEHAEVEKRLSAARHRLDDALRAG